jgi:hypothetical protein
MTRTQAPRVTAAVMSTACTQKNDVGALLHASPAQARSSSTIAFANRGQMTTLNTPATTSTHADTREITGPV